MDTRFSRRLLASTGSVMAVVTCSVGLRILWEGPLVHSRLIDSQFRPWQCFNKAGSRRSHSCNWSIGMLFCVPSLLRCQCHISKDQMSEVRINATEPAALHTQDFFCRLGTLEALSVPYWYSCQLLKMLASSV